MLVAQRYDLGEALGAGGEARVFRARDLRDNREVALRLSAQKPVPPSADDPPPHPNWVRRLDRGGDHEQGSYEVFELLNGVTLETRVGVEPLQPGPWLDFIRQSLDAVAALHAVGWTHGDLNAGNFLHDAGTTWKLLELPFHRSVRPALFGSIYTLAPEQIDGRKPDSRSDVYALGCLYYYAATGVYPHAGGSAAEIAIGRLRFEPEPLQAPALSQRHAEWVMGLLKSREAERPADAGAARSLLGG